MAVSDLFKKAVASGNFRSLIHDTDVLYTYSGCHTKSELDFLLGCISNKTVEQFKSELQEKRTSVSARKFYFDTRQKITDCIIPHLDEHTNLSDSKKLRIQNKSAFIQLQREYAASPADFMEALASAKNDLLTQLDAAHTLYKAKIDTEDYKISTPQLERIFNMLIADGKLNSDSSLDVFIAMFRNIPHKNGVPKLIWKGNTLTELKALIKAMKSQATIAEEACFKQPWERVNSYFVKSDGSPIGTLRNGSDNKLMQKEYEEKIKSHLKETRE